MRQFLLCIKYLFRIKNVLVYKKAGVTQYIYITEKIWKELIYHEPAAVVIIIGIIIS